MAKTPSDQADRARVVIDSRYSLTEDLRFNDSTVKGQDRTMRRVITIARIFSVSLALNAVSRVVAACRIAWVSGVPKVCSFGPLHALTPTLSTNTAIVITVRIVPSFLSVPSECETEIFCHRVPAVNDLGHAKEVDAICFECLVFWPCSLYNPATLWAN